MAWPLADPNAENSPRGQARKAYEDARREANDAYAVFKSERDRMKADGVDLIHDKKAFNKLNGLHEEATEKASAAERAQTLYEQELERSVFGKAHGLDRPLNKVTERWLKAVGARGPMGVKALTDETSAGGVVGAFWDANLADIPSRDLFLLSRLPSVQVEGSDKYDYVRQSSETNNAAPVAAHGVKPESEYGIERLSAPIRVAAHTVSGVDRSLLADFAGLDAFLSGRMRLGVLQALENQILNGDGTGANMTGILNTAGISSVVRDTTGGESTIDAIRRAITTLEVDFIAGDAVVLHPNDWEAIRTAKNADGDYLAAPLVEADPERGLPVVRASLITEGTALVGSFEDADHIRIADREEARVTFVETGLAADGVNDIYQLNELRFRAEGRWGLAVIRPSAFCEVDLVGV